MPSAPVMHPDLCYRVGSEDSWVGVPSWARTLAELGAAIGRLPPPAGSPVAVAVSVPVRTCAAALVAVGVVLGRLLDEAHRVTSEAHFAMLAGLPDGAPVHWRVRDRVLKGLLRGTARHRGCDFIRVQVGSAEGGGRTRWVRKDRVHTIRRADHAGRLPKNQTGRRVEGASSFAEAWLGEEASHLVERARLDCAVVGYRAVLERDLCNRQFAIVSAEEHVCEGCLNDVLRARPIVTSRSGYRAVLRTVKQGVPTSGSGAEPPVAIFDGGLAYLKGRPAVQRLHTVILLDRSEPRFEDATEALRTSMFQGGTEEDVLPELEPDKGLEIYSFRPHGPQ